MTLAVDCCRQRAAPLGLAPLIVPLSLNPLLPQVAVPTGLSPHVCPLPFLVSSEPPDCPCFRGGQRRSPLVTRARGWGGRGLHVTGPPVQKTGGRRAGSGAANVFEGPAKEGHRTFGSRPSTAHPGATHGRPHGAWKIASKGGGGRSFGPPFSRPPQGGEGGALLSGHYGG